MIKRKVASNLDKMNRDIGFFAGMFRDTRRLEYYRRFLDSVAPSLSRKIALFNNRTIIDINLDDNSLIGRALLWHSDILPEPKSLNIWEKPFSLSQLKL